MKQNVTALMTLSQVATCRQALGDGPAELHLRLRRPRRRHRPRPRADHGRRRRGDARRIPKQELIWASPRELLNVFQADAIGCHVITVTNDVLKKLSWSARTWTSTRWRR